MFKFDVARAALLMAICCCALCMGMVALWRQASGPTFDCDLYFSDADVVAMRKRPSFEVEIVVDPSVRRAVEGRNRIFVQGGKAKFPFPMMGVNGRVPRLFTRRGEPIRDYEYQSKGSRSESGKPDREFFTFVRIEE